jgi:hypothetical protein
VNSIVDEPSFSAKAGLLIRDAKFSRPIRFYNACGTWGALGLSAWITRAMYGGFWTGGDLKLYRDRLVLAANAFNAGFFENPPTFNIPLSEIDRTQWRKGMRIGIIDIFMKNVTIPYSFRCEGGRDVLATIDRAIAAL